MTPVAPAATPPAEEPAIVEPTGDPAVPPADPARPVDVPPAEVPPAAEPPGMAQVRKAEQHLRRQIAEERARLTQEFEAQKAAWQAKVDKATALEARLAAARHDQLGAISALGFTEEDYDPLARLLYAHSPEGQKNPANKSAAAQTLAQRQQATEIGQLRSELAEMRQAQAQERAMAAQQAKLNAYLTGVTRAVGDATPLARAALAKDPDRTRDMLTAVADRLWTQSGPSDDLRDVPTPLEVLAAFEADRRAELELYGIDPATIGRPASAPARAIAAVPAPAAPGLPVVPPPAAPKNPPTPEELREQALAGLARLRTVG